MHSDDLDLSGRPLTGSPRDQRRFVDRKDEFDQTWQSLSLRANVLLTGARGMGKTSFLRKLEAELDATDALGGSAYVNAAPARSLEQLVATIHAGLRRKSIELSALPSADTEDRLGLPTYELIGALVPAGPAPLFPTAILLDEPEPEVAHTLFGRLRDATWQLPYTWVVAIDVRDRPRVTRPPADAFFGAIVELDPLSIRSATELLKHHIDRQLPESEIHRLAQLGHGNPRLMIAVARDVLVGRVSLDELEEVDRRRATLLDQASESGRELARYLAASGQASASDPELLAHFNWTRNRAVQVFNELSGLGLVKASVEKGGRRKFYSLA